MQSKKNIRIAILASGSGSNAEQFIHYFDGHSHITIALIVSNNPAAFVLQRAKNNGVKSVVISASDWRNKEFVKSIFFEHEIDAVILAGYLLLIPGWFIELYPDKILNIHPALLPAFGGKGMYGMNVHQAVINSGVDKSGISIHLVNEAYDDGDVIFQKSVAVLPGDTPESLAKRIHALEHKYYPLVTERYLLEKILSLKKDHK